MGPAPIVSIHGNGTAYGVAKGRAVRMASTKILPSTPAPIVIDSIWDRFTFRSPGAALIRVQEPMVVASAASLSIVAHL